MRARKFLKEKGVLDYDEFIAYQKVESEEHIPIEELMEEFLLTSICEYNKINTPEEIKKVQEWLGSPPNRLIIPYRV